MIQTNPNGQICKSLESTVGISALLEILQVGPQSGIIFDLSSSQGWSPSQEKYRSQGWSPWMVAIIRIFKIEGYHVKDCHHPKNDHHL